MMRVFYALTFDQETKLKLADYRNDVANNSIKGTFVDLNNFHLTLEFIGEVNEKELNLLTNILHEFKNFPKELIVSYIGSFKGKNKEVVWFGIENNSKLMILQKQLRKLLINNEFNIEIRKYKPHITMGRQILRADQTEDVIIQTLKLPIYSMALMESKRVSDKLIYESIEELVF